MRQVLYETPGVDPKTLPDAYTEISGGHAALYNGWVIGLVRTLIPSNRLWWKNATWQFSSYIRAVQYPSIRRCDSGLCRTLHHIQRKCWIHQHASRWKVSRSICLARVPQLFRCLSRSKKIPDDSNENLRMQAGYQCQVEVWGVGANANAYALIRSVDFFFSFQIDAITGKTTVNDFNIYNIGFDRIICSWIAFVVVTLC